MTVTISGTSGISGADGSASTPAFQGTDTNTGIYFPGADTIAFTEGGVESGRFTSTGALQLNSNLTFSGTSNRITGDFSNATQANRVMFQTSTANSLTSVAAIPNGTAQASYIAAFNRSTPDNSGLLYISATNTEAQIQSGITGTGTYLPMTFYTGGSERMRIDTSGNLQFNSGYGSVATAYGCRAWVNFDGTGTVAIRASGNVSSITDNGTGQYTVNLTIALPDVNYSVVAIGGFNTNTANQATYYIQDNVTTTSSFRINGVSGNTLAFTDHTTVCVAIFR